jgi:hypothetical protein
MNDIITARWHSDKVAQFTGLEIKDINSISVEYAELKILDDDWDGTIDEVLGWYESKTNKIKIDKANIDKAVKILQQKAPELENIDNIQRMLEDMVLIHEWAHAYDDLGQPKHAWFDHSVENPDRSRIGSDTNRNEFAACYVETRVINMLSNDLPELQLVLNAWEKHIKVPERYQLHCNLINKSKEHRFRVIKMIEYHLDVFFCKWLHSETSGCIWKNDCLNQYLEKLEFEELRESVPEKDIIPAV